MKMLHQWDSSDAPALVLSGTESISYRELAKLCDESIASA